MRNTMSHQITLAVRPSLALPERWSVDFWYDNNIEAAYQAAILTFDSSDDAAAEAASIQSTLQAQGLNVTCVRLTSNASRAIVERAAVETEEEITKLLENYVKEIFAPLKSLSVSNVFNITNWPSFLKTLATGSPHVLSLLVLAVLLFRGPFERLLNSIVPAELNLDVATVVTSAPILLLLTTLHVYYKRARLSSQLDRVTKWILAAVVRYGWDHSRFFTLKQKELAGLEYASLANIFEVDYSRNPTSFDEIMRLSGLSLKEMDENTAAKAQLFGVIVSTVCRDDFAKKVQALAGISREPGYQPEQMAILPFHLLTSLQSIESTMLALSEGKKFLVEFSERSHKGSFIATAIVPLFLSLLPICLAIVWTTALSWRVSLILFTANVVASTLIILLLTWRPLSVLLRHRFIPRGLNLLECSDALNVM